MMSGYIKPVTTTRVVEHTAPTPYQCGNCRHPFYEHRESREWRLNNSRRKRNLTGCARAGCDCAHADDAHCKKV